MKLSNIKKFNSNNLAIAYYRYSSDAQNEESIDQQQEAAHNYAKAKDLNIIKEYKDKAISGTTDERPGYQTMLSEIKKLKPSALILWKIDRLGRDRYLLINARKKIRDAGCKIHLVAEPSLDDSPESALLESLMDGMAEFYSRQLRENVIRGMKHNAKNCLSNGHKIFGYKTGPDKKYTIDHITAPVVQRIFNDYANGIPMVEIAKKLNSQGLRTVKGKEFTINGLRSILKNTRYTGIYKYSDVEIQGGMPVIIEKPLFDKAQQMLEKNKRIKSRKPFVQDDLEGSAPQNYWLTGKLYCGYCHNTMQGISGTSMTGASYYYYSCAGKRKKDIRCKKVNIRKKEMEDVIVHLLRLLLTDSENHVSIAIEAANYYKAHFATSKYLEGLEKENQNTKKKIRNMLKAIEQGVLTETTHSRLLELEKQNKSLENAIKIETAKRKLSENEGSIRAFFEKFKDVNFEDEKMLDYTLEFFVDKIIIFDDRLEINCWYSESQFTFDASELEILKESTDLFEYELLLGKMQDAEGMVFPTDRMEDTNKYKLLKSNAFDYSEMDRLCLWENEIDAFVVPADCSTIKSS